MWFLDDLFSAPMQGGGRYWTSNLAYLVLREITFKYGKEIELRIHHH